MSWPASFFFPHTVRIRDISGGGGMGRRHVPAPGRTVRAEVKDEQQLVRTADGQEVVSNTQVAVAVNDPVALGALVTVWPGLPQEREAEVLQVARNDNAPPLQSFLILSLK